MKGVAINLLTCIIGFTVGFLFIMAVGQAEATMSIYQSETWEHKSVLEVCFDNGKCHRLLTDTKDLDDNETSEWLDMVYKLELRRSINEGKFGNSK